MRYFLLFNFILFTIFSCQKAGESNLSTNPIPVIIPNDSIYISRIIELDTLFAAPLDTVYKLEISYDNQHRITQFMEVMYYNNPAVTTDTPKKVTLFYNGTDTLPFKATMYNNNIAPSETFETHFYLFSNTNPKVLIYDSIRYTTLANGNTGLKVTGCSYYTDSTLVTERYYQTGTTKYNIIKNNGNIIFQDDGFIVSNQKYDFNPNPLFKLKFLQNEFYRIGAEWNENRYLEFERNNLSEINNENSISRTKLKYYYTYNSNGHPMESRIQNLLSNPQRPNKIKYYYTK